jgi:hypothetical protein
VSDQFIPGGRTATPFSHTGIWMFLLGIPLILALTWLVRQIRPYYSEAPGAMRKTVLGLGVMLAGAIGVETLANVTSGTALVPLQVALEELLEMLGATIVLWGGYELLERHGFALVLHPARRATGEVARGESPVHGMG